MLLHVPTVLITVAIASVGVRADCYSRDGILAKDSKVYKGDPLTPCGRGSNTCCLPDEKCGTNLLCATRGGDLSRQYCANKEWEGCSELSPDHGLAVRDCGGNIVCYFGLPADCCAFGPLYYVNPLTGEVKNASLRDSTATVSPTYWEVTSSTVISSSTTSPVSTTVVSSTTPASTNTTAPISNPSSKLSARAGAGIGVGAAALLGVFALLVWFCTTRRKKQKAARTQVGPHDSGAAFQYQGTAKSSMHEMPHPQPVSQRHELSEGRPTYQLP
ncbi:hypothetical protein CC86DRAFT_415172 [Ophiobolus disseminans]|uniref:Mid2 domain-containing protein n=1 Tax=Ophiobolus disseminans TaxID=1469910 RepID=A0A6A7AL45_9PLEO|nr:hypothetical protein CC86DRAFT_415172 [Ophiobolus disseminans]